MTDATPQINTFALTSRAGIKRDGTDFDSEFWHDGQWVRFQRGRPRKMGGYVNMSTQISGPARNIFVDSRNPNSSVHIFSRWGVEQMLFASDGTPSGSISDRTPAGFVANANYTWQSAAMFQSGGSGTPTLVALNSPDLADIATDTNGALYSGDITGSAALTAVTDGTNPVVASGGVCVLQPFVVVYGSNGFIRNSNANNISGAAGWVGTNANTANVAGTKIVRGLPIRGGGQSPAGLFWALDALIRMSYVSSTVLWKYDTLSDDITVMSKDCIVEFDNAYYWLGVDRFYVFNGVVQELPNQMNINWLFDNLNFAQRQKVWALKIPRFGEIWWFFPFGSDTECSAAVCFNVRENTWYDTRIERSAGFPARVFPRPIMAGELTATTALRYTPTGGAFTLGETIQGATSLATGKVARATSTQLNLIDVTGTFQNGETIADLTHGGIDTGTVTAAPFSQDLTNVWQHEQGTDRVVGTETSAIQANLKSNNFQYMTGGPVQQAAAGANLQTRLLRLEPDFIMTGSMTVTVAGKSFAQSDEVVGDPYTFDSTTEYIDLREQRRELSLTLESNEAGGDFQMGRILITVEPGDERG